MVDLVEAKVEAADMNLITVVLVWRNVAGWVTMNRGVALSSILSCRCLVFCTPVFIQRKAWS